MSGWQKKALWIGLGLAVTLQVLWTDFPLSHGQSRLKCFPVSGMGFESQSLPLTPAERATFGGTDMTKRLYRFGHEQFIVLVIDGSRDRHAVHDPLYCFRGAGWRVLVRETLHVTGGEAQLVRLSKKGAQTEALYWFSDGSHRYISPLRYWWQTTLRRLTLGYSGGEPVLVIIQPVDTDIVNWSNLVKNFWPAFEV